MNWPSCECYLPQLLGCGCSSGTLTPAGQWIFGLLPIAVAACLMVLLLYLVPEFGWRRVRIKKPEARL